MDTQIVQVKIHPAIGIARVGNSDKQPFIGPESPDQPPLPPGSYKDSSGKVIRQAARFRVYGYNQAGEAVRELKLGEDGVTEIKWSVHLANKKAAWYQFHVPLDIREALSLPDTQLRRRNFDVRGADRKKLVIDIGRKQIRASLHETAALSGKIMNRAVPLGSIAAQSDGRLLVVGGVGASASYATPEKPISGVANNDTWYDDVSDGPVTAEVTIGGVTKAASPAWAVVAPPHYAPGVKTVRTLYDLLYDVFVTEHTLPAVQQISYPEHIEPLLSRFCDLQWVNHGFATQFGWEGPHHFLHPAMRKRLADPGDASRELRRQVYVQMRDYERDGTSPCPGRGSTATPCPAANPTPSASTSRSPASRTGCWPCGQTAASPPARPARATRTWTRRPSPHSRVCWTGPRWTTAPPTRSTRAARSPGRCGTRPCTPSPSASCSAPPRTRNPTTEMCSASRTPWARTVRCTRRGRATSPAGWPPPGSATPRAAAPATRYGPGSVPATAPTCPPSGPPRCPTMCSRSPTSRPSTPRRAEPTTAPGRRPSRTGRYGCAA